MFRRLSLNQSETRCLSTANRCKSLLLALCSTLLAGCASDTLDVTPNACSASGVAEPHRLFLEQTTSTSALVSWRGDANTLCIESAGTDFTQVISALEMGVNKQASVTGLSPDTSYRYSLDGSSAVHEFRTAPAPGTTPDDGTIRLWILGDSGTVTEIDAKGQPEHPGVQQAVRDAFVSYEAENRGADRLDLVLLLGDNAYPSGTDAQWQRAYFEMYADMIASVATVPTIGNHEMGTGKFDICAFRAVDGCDSGPVHIPVGGASFSADPASYDSNGDGPDGTGLPYLNIFSLPSRGEWGGEPSGTEQYYSLDYGNVHIVSLDSQLTVQDPEQLKRMKDWLRRDLRTNTLDWTIVIFHHPPYSKGENHDSDVEVREIRMRESFAPIFDEFTVDLVFSGHAHNYERSWYMGGHYGPSSTFDPGQHAELDERGQPAFGHSHSPYPQISRMSSADDKVVYAVAGSSGKAGHFKPCPPGQTLGCTLPDWLNHPAHRTFSNTSPDHLPHGIARAGSVLVEATDSTLVTRFIDVHGDVLDHFVISRR